MKRILVATVAMTVGVLTLSVEVAFANNLHFPVGNQPPAPNDLYSFNSGQTGSNVLSSCSPTKPPTLGNGDGMTAQKVTTGDGSPFNQTGDPKKYAGNPGNKSPNGVSQYDNACAQAQLHQLP
jgi:hypothetical protein